MPRASVTGVSFWPRRPRESRNLTSKHFALTSGYRVVRRRSIGCLPTGDGGSFLRSLLLVLIYAAPCAHERCDPCAFLLVRRSFVELISLMVRFSMLSCAHCLTKLSGSLGISIHMFACAIFSLHRVSFGSMRSIRNLAGGLVHGLPLGVTVQRRPCTFMQVDWTYRAPSARSGLPSCTHNTFVVCKNDGVLQRKTLKPNPIKKGRFY